MQKDQETKYVKEINNQDVFESLCGNVKFCLIVLFDSVKVSESLFIYLLLKN